MNFQNLIVKEYYANTQKKFTSISEGAQEIKKYRESLSEQQIAEFKKQAEEINSKNEKISKQYEIPVLGYKNFRSYISTLQRRDNIGSISDLDEKALSKYQN